MDIRFSYCHNDFHCFADIAMRAAKVQQIRRDGNAWWGLHQLTNAYLSSLNSAAVCHRSSFRQHMQVVYSVSMGPNLCLHEGEMEALWGMGTLNMSHRWDSWTNIPINIAPWRWKNRQRVTLYFDSPLQTFY